MAVDVESLRIVIDVLGNWRSELSELQAELAAIDDDITIDVDVDRELGDVATSAARRGTPMTSGGQNTGPASSFDSRLRDVRQQLGTLSRLTGADFDVSDVVDRRDVARGLENMTPSEMGELLFGGSDFGDFLGEDVFDFDRITRDVRRRQRPFNRLLRRLNLRMSDFHNLLAQMIPMLVVFVGALPAAISAIGTLAAAALAAAGAFGVIGGLGALALAQQRGGGDIGAGFREMVQELRESFLDAFMPLARSFDDVASDALGGVEDLFDAIAARGDVLINLKEDARAFGGFLLEFIPGALAQLGLLADAVTPIFDSLAQWVEATNFTAAFADALRRALPALTAVAGSIVALAPLVFELSLGFLNVVGAVLWFTTALSNLLSIFGIPADIIGGLIGSLLALATATILANKATMALAGTWLVTAKKEMVRYALALKTKIAILTGYTGATWRATLATWGFTAAVSTFLAVVTLGAIILLWDHISKMGTSFGNTASQIDEATKSLSNFRRESRRLDSTSAGGLPAGSLSDPSAGAGGTTVNNFYGDTDQEDVRRAQRKQSFVDKLLSGLPM